MIMRRLVWMGSGYVAGAASSWWVQRKVRRTAERVLPEAVRNEVGARISDTVGTVGKSVGYSVERARAAVVRVRPETFDLRRQDSPIS